MIATSEPIRTVVVLGASYGGARAARILADELPDGWRLVVLERNSHMNHVYVFPRFIIEPQHAPKGFVPYARAFDPQGTHAKASRSDGTAALSSDGRHSIVQGLVTHIGPSSLTYLSPSPSYDHVMDSGAKLHHDDDAGVERHELHFDYLIYALGAGLPQPCDVWGDGRAPIPSRGLKSGGLEWMQEYHDTISDADSVAVIGGGALGIQFATDIKDTWPSKTVTLVHSRKRLMPIYPEAMHDEIVRRLEELGVEVILGERVMEWSEEGEGKKRIKTSGGTVVEADLVMACTGQKPRVELLRGLANVDPVSGRIRVKEGMQIEPLVIAAEETEEAREDASKDQTQSGHANGVGHARNGEEKEDGVAGRNGESRRSGNTKDVGDGLAAEFDALKLDSPLSRIYAVGDCANTSAIQAGHTAYYMAEVAARNVLRDIRGRESGKSEKPETYTPGPPAIKVTLGRKHYVTCTNGEVTTGDDGVDDLQARLMWGPLNAGDLPDDA